MRNVLILICLAYFVVPTLAENLIINPGFDETPWDTGWTWHGWVEEGTFSATPDTERYYTSHRSCMLRAMTSWRGAYIDLFQEIQPAVSCTCRVYFQNRSYNSMYTLTEYRIYVKVNNNYQTEWVCEGDNPVWTKWEKIYTSSDTISSIEFGIIAGSGLHGNVGDANFWIDDVYISGTVVGIEENVSNNKEIIKIYPNPFRERTVISYSLFVNGNDASRLTPYALRIFDVSGRLIRTIPLNLCNPNKSVQSVIWDGKDRQGNEVLSGVYFIRLVTLSGESLCPNKKLVKF
ncbi:T9SS type A sorting domain-containing protein [candidate division WOR-3 bacterium]|nr:T9SS type A sorting domain-containing protein [candidate division WOR-3 bacterium]